MEFILDTNICIYIIKQKPLAVLNKFSTMQLGQICISSITLAELQFGIRKSSNPTKNSKALNKFLTPIEILDFDFYAALEYGNIRASLEKKGTPIGDCQSPGE